MEERSKQKIMRSVLVIMIFFIIRQKYVSAETYDNIKNDFSDNINEIAFTGTDSIRPITDSTLALNVTLGWNLVSINDFDETNGYMDVSGFLILEWRGESFQTTINAVDLIKPKLMWKPPVVLLNSVKTYDLIGHDASVKIRYNFLTKECQWKPWVVARASCSPDVKYYPFDKQSCAFRLSIWGYHFDEVNLMPKDNTWSFLYFEENGEWKIDETSVETSVLSNFSVIDLKMKLTRRPLYYIINLIAPVLLLSAVSAFTFLLPVESGERIGFSVTCFLSYVVLLNIIMGFLPSSGIPLSHLSYYTFVMMVFSAFNSIMTIVTVRIYHKSEDDPVPAFLAYFFKCFTCRLWYCQESGTVAKRTITKDKVVPIDTASATWDDDSLIDDVISQSSDDRSSDTMSQKTEQTIDERVTWKNIASFIDIFLFFSFLGGQIFYSVAYLVPIFVN